MASLTIENYVKTIHELCASDPGSAAATGQIATALDVSPGTVTSMLKTLDEAGLVTYTPYEGVVLTTEGRNLARRVLRRHRLIEQFLVQTLNLTWDEVHDEAEHMEHAVSDLLIDRIDAFLGYPKADPHGDPIPQPDGTLPAAKSRRLALCSAGQAFRLVRVLDQKPEFLQFLSQAGLEVGVEGQVVSNEPQAGVVTVEVSHQRTNIGHDAADKLLVTVTVPEARNSTGTR